MSANGRLPADQLTVVQYGLSLPNQMARQWLLFVAEATRHFGPSPRITYSSIWPAPPPEVGGLGAYRTLACQQWMWDHRNDGGIRRQCARPGHSVHGTTPGCVDIYNWDDFPRAAFVQLAAAFGLIANTVAKEPWHFQYNGTTVSGGDVTPFPPVVAVDDPTGRNDDMPLVLLKQSTAAGAQGGTGVFALYDPSAKNAESRWMEFNEYGLARALVDACHNRRKDAVEASAILIPDYAWAVWKERAIADPAHGGAPIPPEALAHLATKQTVTDAQAAIVEAIPSPAANADELAKRLGNG